jgi:nucleoside-diphosphate-sugar epimerase
MKFTVFGSTGFIGTNICQFLKKGGIEYFTPERDYRCNKNINLGHVIYGIGLTADFRSRPIDTVQAHVGRLIEILENSSFDSFVYLSTTRVYLNSQTGNELSDLVVNPSNPDDLYNISKLMGESVCLSYKKENIKIARISNVIGRGININSFLYSILNDIKTKNKLALRSSIYSEKDYINIDDVVHLLFKIAVYGQKQLYNVASGVNISNKEILDIISKTKPFEMLYETEAPLVKSPQIDIGNISQEFKFNSGNVINKIEDLIQAFFKT